MTTEPDAVRATLFADTDAARPADGERLLLMEQYKIYADSMEKVVARRQTAHSVFLTANAFLLSAGGFVLKGLGEGGGAFNVAVALIPVAVPGLMLCILWYQLTRYYASLNEAKFAVLKSLEARLPASIYGAEWVALGEGRDPSRYRSMATVESTVSVVFLLCHALLLLVGGSLLFASLP